VQLNLEGFVLEQVAEDNCGEILLFQVCLKNDH